MVSRRGGSKPERRLRWTEQSPEAAGGGSKPERRRQTRTEQSPDAAAAAAYSIASVFGNRYLLADILLRLDSPTWLVRAALASKSWLRVASDPDFLDRFRALQPPRVLGISNLRIPSLPSMVPVPQPPELAATARLADRALGNLWGMCVDYCNGRLLMETEDISNRPVYAVASLLDEAREKMILPPPPPVGSADDGPYLYYGYRLFLLEDDGGDAMSCLYLSMACGTETLRADFSVLRSGVWGVPQTVVRDLEQEPSSTVLGHKLLSGQKLYMMTTVGSILVLDLANITFSAIELPDGAEHCALLKFSRAKKSGLYLIGVMGIEYLIGVMGIELRVWHGDGTGQWVLVDTIDVREACAKLNVQSWVPGDAGTSPVWIVGVGDYAEFVILELAASRILCCMQLSNRVVEKVIQAAQKKISGFVCPITMVWPPFLPVPAALE